MRDKFLEVINQVMILTVSNLRARYRGTMTGMIWVALNPILLFSAQAFAFNYIVKLNINYFPLYLASGLIPWIFVSQSLEMGTPILYYQGRTIKNYQLHPLVFVCSQVLDNCVNFLIAISIILGFLQLFYGSVNLVTILCLVMAIIPMVATVCAWCVILTATQVFFKDLKFILSFCLQMMFYFTPILFPANWIPVNWKWISFLNPFYYLISPFQAAIYFQDMKSFLWAELRIVILCAVSILIASLYWRRVKNEVMNRI